MSKVNSVELSKLVSTALECGRAASDGDAAEASRASDVLKQLKKFRVTSQLLKETEAGKKISKLKKHELGSISEAASAVIDEWKRCVKQESTSEGKSDTAAQSNASSDKSKEPMSDSHASKSKPVLQAQPKATGDSTRDKIRSMLAQALSLALCDVEGGQPAAVAEIVEEAMLRQNGGVTGAYKSKYRSISFNLKDPSNPDLRRKVLSEEIPAEVLIEMTSEQMASDARREENEKIRDHAKRECERGNNSTATTDAFQCGKCKQRKCTYFQMQTRSADEPMTTFVTCTVCGNKWKFC